MNRRKLTGGRLGAWPLGLVVLAIGAVLLVPRMRAQAAAQQPAQAAQAVRLSNVYGQVRVAQGGQLLADPALVNTPLFAGTQVTTGDDGRAELQFDNGGIVRLAPDSSLTLAILPGAGANSNNGANIVLNSGLGYFELQGGSATGSIRVGFGRSVVTANGFTVLRIDMDSSPGALAVFSGNAHLERGDLALDLHGGESLALDRTDLSQYSVAESIEPDSWDAWNSDRDQALLSEAAERTSAPDDVAGNQTGDGQADEGQPESDNPAWNDLDANGNWYDLPGEGEVWSPDEASSTGWDPYSNGSWMWTPDYGYIWVSGDAWGYLPSIYGMWNYYDGFGWGWSPRTRHPWWGSGGWAYRIGRAPFGYHRPERPLEGAGGLFNAGISIHTHPVIAVNRRWVVGTTGLSAQGRGGTTMLAGNGAESPHASASRPLYSRADSRGDMNLSRPAYAGEWTAAGPLRSAGDSAGSASRTSSYSGGTRTNTSSGSHSGGGGATGQFRSGQARSGQAQSGQSRSGQARSGQSKGGGGFHGGGRGGAHR